MMNMILLYFVTLDFFHKVLFLYSRSWQEEEAEAASSYPRSPPAEDPVPHPSIFRDHRLCCCQGSYTRQGRSFGLCPSPAQEATVQGRAA